MSDVIFYSCGHAFALHDFCVEYVHDLTKVESTEVCQSCNDGKTAPHDDYCLSMDDYELGLF